MIRKIIFGRIWFVVIFMVSDTGGGIIYVILTGTDTSGGMTLAASLA